ncbi:MAG: helix-turn-helix domain-containing protein [Clostridia bacterium]|nr:helix-turn-helix domain-containing protein [Clostridia bacterium]
MNYGQKIAELRKGKGLTQSELGAHLNISAQAVSKWENDLSEPDLDSIKKLCELFGVSVDVFLGITPNESKPQETAVATETIKIINGYCEKCKKPVGPDEYELSNLTYNDSRLLYKIEESNTQHVFCNDCFKYIKELKAKEDAKKKLEKKIALQKQEKARFKKGLIWGPIVSVVVFVLIFLFAKQNWNGLSIGLLVGLTIGGFTVTSQIFWGEFIGDVFSFFCRSFKAPFGLIFELSLDGILWLLTVKFFLWVFFGLLSIAWFILGIFVTSFISYFTFPFQLASKIKKVKTI